MVKRTERELVRDFYRDERERLIRELEALKNQVIGVELALAILKNVYHHADQTKPA